QKTRLPRHRPPHAGEMVNLASPFAALSGSRSKHPLSAIEREIAPRAKSRGDMSIHPPLTPARSKYQVPSTKKYKSIFFWYLVLGSWYLFGELRAVAETPSAAPVLTTAMAAPNTSLAPPARSNLRSWNLRQTPVVDVVRRVKDAVVNIHSE